MRNLENGKKIQKSNWRESYLCSWVSFTAPYSYPLLLKPLSMTHADLFIVIFFSYSSLNNVQGWGRENITLFRIVKHMEDKFLPPSLFFSGPTTLSIHGLIHPWTGQSMKLTKLFIFSSFSVLPFHFHSKANSDDFQRKSPSHYQPNLKILPWDVDVNIMSDQNQLWNGIGTTEWNSFILCCFKQAIWISRASYEPSTEVCSKSWEE